MVIKKVFFKKSCFRGRRSRCLGRPGRPSDLGGPRGAHGGIISYNRANNLRLCVHLGLPWIMSRRLPSHMQFSHGPLLIMWHARQSSANLFRQPEPLWTSTDHELMRGCLQLVMHVAWTSTAARPCAMQHVDFQRASVMRVGSLTRSQISRIDSPPLRPPRGLQPELW